MKKKKNRKECKLWPDKFRLQLLTNIDMLLVVEKSIRGGIMLAVKRSGKVNNKYMGKSNTIIKKRVYI